MGRDEKHSGRGDPENKRSAPRGSGARWQTGFLGRATAQDAGHSGYGSESVRPYLRAQLKLKELLGSPFIPPEPDEDKPARKKSRWGR